MMLAGDVPWWQRSGDGDRRVPSRRPRVVVDVKYTPSGVAPPLPAAHVRARARSVGGHVANTNRNISTEAEIRKYARGRERLLRCGIAAACFRIPRREAGGGP